MESFCVLVVAQNIYFGGDGGALRIFSLYGVSVGSATREVAIVRN